LLDTLITSKTRIKLLLKFFLNGNTQGYLRNLESEFGDSTNAIRLELNKFEQAGMLESAMEGNKKVFKANTGHPLFLDIQTIVRKYVGIDRIIENVIRKAGDLQMACLVGDYARGMDSGRMEVLLVGDHLNTEYINTLVKKASGLIHREVEYHIVPTESLQNHRLTGENCIVLWKSDFDSTL
jgi:hypothetical protein